MKQTSGQGGGFDPLGLANEPPKTKQKKKDPMSSSIESGKSKGKKGKKKKAEKKQEPTGGLFSSKALGN